MNAKLQMSTEDMYIYIYIYIHQGDQRKLSKSTVAGYARSALDTLGMSATSEIMDFGSTNPPKKKKKHVYEKHLHKCLPKPRPQCFCFCENLERGQVLEGPRAWKRL